MANINITTTELLSLLDITPADQNLMLVGNHGIGKSEILTEYFSGKGMKVVPLFLGQMSDPGDLIGIPNRNNTIGKTEFMPPYWFPLDGKPIVLFLDELNRARPEVLQTIMDLALNRTLAGRKLPDGSRIISAVNDGDQYQLTDLDPALVSRFNVVTFRPTTQEGTYYRQSFEMLVLVILKKNVKQNLVILCLGLIGNLIEIFGMRLWNVSPVLTFNGLHRRESIFIRVLLQILFYLGTGRTNYVHVDTHSSGASEVQKQTRAALKAEFHP